MLYGVVAAPPPDSGLAPSTRTPTAVVIGDGCGETVDAFAGVRLVTASGIAPMACADDQVFVVDEPPGDPIGAAGCRVGSVELGLVVEAPGERALWLHPREAPPRVLVDGLANDDAGERWTSGGDTIVARLDDASIVAVVLGGSITDPMQVSTVATAAVDFRVGEGRWLIWQGVGSDGTGPVRRTDLRGATAEIELATGRLADEPLPLYGPYLLLRSDGQRLVFRLEDGAALELPAGWSFRRHLPDGRIWLHRDAAPYGELDEVAWDPATGQTVAVYAGPGSTTYADDALEVLVPSAEAGIQRGRLLLAAWDGSGTVVIGDDVGWHRRRLDDGRVLSVVQTQDEPPLGTLALHEAGHEGPVQLATDVLATSLRINSLGGGDNPFAGDFLWVGAHGDARALWRIRIPPPLSP